MKNQIKKVRKRRFCQPVAKHEERKTIKSFDKNLRQVVFSAQNKKPQQNLTFRSEFDKKRKDTESKNQPETNEREYTN